MKLTRPVIGIVSVAAIGAFALPSHAAGKSATLFFDNQGASTPQGCTPSYVLSRVAPSGSPCEGPTLGYAGNGEFTTDVYNSQSSAVGWKLDAKRPLTGTIYVANYPIVSGGAADNVHTFGGPSGADVTIKINGVKVGTVSGNGVAAPNSAVAIPVKLKLPAKLNNKKIRSVEADVAMNSGVLLTGVNYESAAQSKLVFPTR
jgi:hypothetical protein